MVWTRSEKQLKEFITESKTSLYKVCLQVNKVPRHFSLIQINKIQVTLCQKSSDHQNFRNAKLEHPYSLKYSP